MTIDIAAFGKRISRRAVLGSGVALATGPVLADECRIGPPLHEKGPIVWMDMDKVELDAAYDQSFYAPLASQITKRWASNSDDVRARLGAPQRESYGPSE
jgi:arylformamidase